MVPISAGQAIVTPTQGLITLPIYASDPAKLWFKSHYGELSGFQIARSSVEREMAGQVGSGETRDDVSSLS